MADLNPYLGDYQSFLQMRSALQENEYTWNGSAWEMSPGGSQIGAIATFESVDLEVPATAGDYTYFDMETTFANAEVASLDGDGAIRLAYPGLYSMSLRCGAVPTTQPVPANTVEKMIYLGVDSNMAQFEGVAPYSAYYNLDVTWVESNE